MGSQEERFETAIAAFPLVEQSICINFGQRKTLVADTTRMSVLLLTKTVISKSEVTYVRGNDCAR